MLDLTNNSILICCSLKKERLLLFNFFDSNEVDMIHTAKDVADCEKIMSSEDISYLVVECAKGLIENPQQLKTLMQKFPKVHVALIVNKNFSIRSDQFEQYKSITNTILFEPLSELEVSLKIFCQKNNHDKALPVTSGNDEEKIKEPLESSFEDSSNEVWDTFFTNALEAKVIVNAADHKITHVNEALLEITQCKESQLIGQSWKFFDDQSNHDKYDGYIKEINSNEQITFAIKNIALGKSQDLLAQYQMAVLNGDIVFMGRISREDVQGVSSQVFSLLKRTHQVDIFSQNFLPLLEDIRKYLNFTFLMFFELHDKKLSRPIVVGNKSVVKKILNQSKESLFSIINGYQAIEIDINNDRMSEYIDMLSINNLQSMCVYPICHQESTFGSLIAGGQSQVDSWQTITSILNAITSQCRFGLFQKSINNQKERQEQLDTLTGLPNRNSMTNKFAEIMENGVTDGKYIALMLIDIEKLNYMNNKLNIELFDEIILCISKIIVQSIRAYGQVYRLSEDDFLVLLNPHVDKKLVDLKAKELIKKLNQSILLSNGTEMKINYNIGVSIFPDDGQTISSMMKNADLAMYDAKMAGKNNYIVFKFSETGKALKQKTEMEENLRIAIEEGHIKVFLQPKIDAKTEDIIGFEALVRWIDPEIGMINPGHFIPLAEETGLINEIGEYIAQKACELVVNWQKRYGLNLTCSINLSVVQLIDPELPRKLEKIINASGVHPHFIDFEITETISLDVVPNLVESLNEIVKIGCTLSIDDFGTGHSSLDYIKKIPAHFIKVDQSFVKNIGLNPEDEAILDATIDMAKRLNRKIVAEGVETEEQREYLQERACEYFQGFLFARPMPEEEIEKLLEQREKLMGHNK